MEKDDDRLCAFPVLPEGCISHILSLTSSKDACRSSAVSWEFKLASESDTVWERFFPQDYQKIISASVTPLHYASKRELFFRLCQSPILLNGGTLSFWLSKSSGKKCYMLCARELSIAGKDTPTHWNWTSMVESRFLEVGELLNVCWLDIPGKMQTKMLSSETYYEAYLVFKITDNSYGIDCAMSSSVKFTNSSNGDECDGVFLTRIAHTYLLTRRRWRRRRLLEERTQSHFPEQRNDGWMEIYLGKFFASEGEDEIEMRLYETKVLHWKKGLIIEGIELRPLEDS